jgi:ribosome-associated protein
MKKLEGLKLARFCRQLAEDKKAINPVILDLRKLNGPAEWFLICSAQSDPQLKAIADGIHKGMKEDEQGNAYGRDGSSASKWIVLDYGSILVHIMHEDLRGYYSIENLWNDAKKIK